RAPAAAAARQPLDLEPLRWHFAGDAAVALANDLGLGAPGGDAGRVIGVGGEPSLDGAATVGRQLAVDIGVQFVFADHLVCHRSLSYFTRRSAGRSPSRKALICIRARASRDMIVPIGTPCTSATSR